MAKQTFTTGQVLTAAQMTSLQETAMGGGAPNAKTASYVLVAADAGKVIQMNSASSTTITVNTGLFSAGDVVQIQNIGAGTMTITAGTATVNSAGSLAVSQYDGGFLYFNSASAALWFDYTQPGTTSPLTTKGDLYTRTSSADARLGVGTDGQTLVADSSTATGLKWAAPASGSTFVGCFLYKSGHQSVNHDTQTVITFDSESYDTDAFHSTSTNTGRITIPSGKGGKYIVGGSLAAQSGTNNRAAYSQVNGTTQITVWNKTESADSNTYNTWSFLYNLTAGDYIEFLYFQAGGGAKNVYGGDATVTTFYCIYLGA